MSLQSGLFPPASVETPQSGEVAAALAHIQSLAESRMTLGLDRIGEALRRLDHPQSRFPAVHIAGTNGKGSTAAFTAKLLERAGLKVGLFTSPHLLHFRERIRLQGRPIDDGSLVRLTQTIREVATGVGLTYFEFATVMAFLYFSQQSVDVAVVEVGLGGRLDATRLCEPAVCVVTTVGHDHQKWLGNTLEAIAGEKAAIIRPGVPVVCGVTGRGRHVVHRVACEQGAPIVYAGRASRYADSSTSRKVVFNPVRREADLSELEDLVGGRSGLRVRLNLLGDHQRHNAACALAAVGLLEEQGRIPRLSDQSLAQGLADAHWPGRCHQLQGLDGTAILVDGAHNTEAIRVLQKFVSNRYGGQRVVMLVGVLGRKDARSIVRGLCKVAVGAVFVPLEGSSGSWCPKELARLAPPMPEGTAQGANFSEGLEVAARMAGKEGVVVVAGSLHLAGQALAQLGEDPASLSALPAKGPKKGHPHPVEPPVQGGDDRQNWCPPQPSVCRGARR